MADILSGLLGGSEAPDYQAPSLDPSEEQFLKDQIERNSGPANYDTIMKRRLAGASGTNLVNPAAKSDIDGKAMSEAIKQKSMKAYDSDMAKMKMQAELQSEIEKGSDLNRASRLVNQIVSANRAIDNRIRKAIENKQAARNQVLSNILGVGGMVAGAAIAGPIGAGVGGKVGSSMTGNTEMDPLSGGSDYFSEQKPRRSSRYSVLE
jgi:hypothetical protein